MSLLTMIGDATNSMGFAAPTAVITSTDQMIRELLALANTSGRALVISYPWQEIIKECTFTSTATYNQGTIDGGIVTAADFQRMLDNTLWDRTGSLKATGPINSSEWQQDAAFMAAAPYPKYRIWRGQLFIGPIGSPPASGDTWAFEYVSKNFCQGQSGTGQATWAADTDTGVLSENLMKLDIIWRWKASKSLEYADDLQSFEEEWNALTGQTTGGRALYLGGANVIFPINVPEGNWPTS